MKAYDYVEKLLNDCEGNQKEFSIRLKNSLVRLTKRYNAIEQEQIITKIIKGEIFSYVFVPEIPRKHAITINEQIECGLALHHQPPTVDDLSKRTYAGYILVKKNSTLYFINRLDKDDKIKSFLLPEHGFNKLISELKIDNDVQIIPLLSNAQQNLIKEITGYTPIISRLSSTYPQEWLALTPSQANTIIQNPGEKITISLGERYGAVDIDCLWVVQEEAGHDFVQDNIEPHKFVKTPISELKSRPKAPRQVVYTHIKELPKERRETLIQTLQNGSPDQRDECIKDDVAYCMKELGKAFPDFKVCIEPTVKMVFRLHRPIFEVLKITQPLQQSYITIERKQRNQKRSKSD